MAPGKGRAAGIKNNGDPDHNGCSVNWLCIPRWGILSPVAGPVITMVMQIYAEDHSGGKRSAIKGTATGVIPRSTLYRNTL